MSRRFVVLEQRLDRGFWLFFGRTFGTVNHAMSNTGTEQATQELKFDNVFLFGAGVSAAAGVPLLKPFLDKMWEYSIRERVNDTPLSKEDCQILGIATNIRIALERYNSRANFNDRNIEDILSLLSFEALRGGDAKEDYNKMVRAVAKTIELSGSLKYQEQSPRIYEFYKSLYHEFWRLFLTGELKGMVPAIITFNYDLILERALWETFHYHAQDSQRYPIDSIKLKYYYGEMQFAVKTHDHLFTHVRENQETRVFETKGFRPSFIYDPNEKTRIEIPYFKLHGSLNWPLELQIGSHLANPPTKAIDSPLILPPVFNKMNTTATNNVWSTALSVLQHAKHIVVVGYSLPRTDIYMQYFLKAAVGPNSSLQKITVFNPALFNDNEEAREMKSRYEDCFSRNFANRIDFRPPVAGYKEPRPDLDDYRDRIGTFNHFVSSVRNDRTNTWKHEPLLF